MCVCVCVCVCVRARVCVCVRHVADIFVLVNDTDQINILQDEFQKHSVLNFTQEQNKDNKIPFLDVLNNTYSNNNKFTTSTYKNPSKNKSCILNFNSECVFRYKIAIIHNLITQAKFNSFSKILYHKESKALKKTLINNGFHEYNLMNKLKVQLKIVASKRNTATHNPIKTHFYHNQMHCNNKLDEHILKMLIRRNTHPLTLIKSKDVHIL